MLGIAAGGVFGALWNLEKQNGAKLQQELQEQQKVAQELQQQVAQAQKQLQQEKEVSCSRRASSRCCNAL